MANFCRIVYEYAPKPSTPVYAETPDYHLRLTSTNKKSSQDPTTRTKLNSRDFKMKPFNLVFVVVWVATTCRAALGTTNEAIPCQDLIADHENVFNAFLEVRNLATDIASWSNEVYGAISKHLYYDHAQRIIPRKSYSAIEFLHLSHGQTVHDALILVTKRIESIKYQAERATLYANYARLDPHQLFRGKCYCEKFKAGWFSPPDTLVDWPIDLARKQTAQYRLAISWADMNRSSVEKLKAELSRLDEMIALEDSFQNNFGPAAEYRLFAQPTQGGRAALEQVKMLRKQIGKSLERKFNTENFESVKEVIKTRSWNLTMLSGMENSFNRASASIDLACAMAHNTLDASAMHKIAYGSANKGLCGIAG